MGKKKLNKHRQIPISTKRKLWVVTAGRCQYPGCTELLWRDSVTYQELNKSYIAHIEAVSEGGARYNKILARDKSKLHEFSNLMLLCDTHHRLIDNVSSNGVEPHIHHSVDKLKRIKRSHEEMIEFMTSFNSLRNSYPMLLKCNMEKFKINFDIDDIREAMLPDRRPKTPQTIDIDLTKSSITEEDENFWRQNAFEIKQQLNFRIQQGPDRDEINHLSIFAMGPIPLLIYFGYCLGDIIDTNLYQKHRNAGWKWEENNEDSDFEYQTIFPQDIDNYTEGVLEISISGNITDNQYPEHLKNIPRFTFKADNPGFYFLNTYEKFELFRKEIREFMNVVREEYPQISKLHLLSAIPCPIAIEFGRAYMKEYPKIFVYNSSREERIFKFALEIN